jgi:hypothetical protein
VITRRNYSHVAQQPERLNAFIALGLFISTDAHAPSVQGRFLQEDTWHDTITILEELISKLPEKALADGETASTKHIHAGYSRQWLS